MCRTERSSRANVLRRGLAPGLRRVVTAFGAIVLAAGLAACSVTGRSFNSAGLNQIVEGQTTQAEAIRSLGAAPVNTWARSDGSVLARWAYKGTVATDALYLRQEVWLLFGPDGTFQRTENSINIPFLNHTRTAEQAAREAAKKTPPVPAAAVPQTAAPQTVTSQTAVPPIAPSAEPLPVAPPVQPQPVAAPIAPPEPEAVTHAAAPVAGGPLLPPGTTYIPGVSYPIGR
ncbi:MAG: hypothetical protein L0H54_09775 [Alcaligenaceae bacterium]|nr:hypothetical protein [Alcaligenaceae bacterium]